jgi:hypothetical protein
VPVGECAFLVILAKAGIHNLLKQLDSRFRGNNKMAFLLFFCIPRQALNRDGVN